MNHREKYFQKNIAKRILHKDVDFLTAILVNDTVHGIATSDYRDFLYKDDGFSGEGFLGAFHGFRKSAIEKSIDLHQRVSSEIGLDFSDDKVKVSIYGLGRREFRKHKDYLAKHSDHTKIHDDHEKLVDYDPEGDLKVQIHHLNTMKKNINDDMTIEDLLKVSDPKYLIGSTPKGHLTGEKFHHAGNFNNIPSINDPYHPEIASIPNDYYIVLKDKRDELISHNIDTASLSVGLISGLLMLGTLSFKNKSLLKTKIEKYKVQKGLVRVTVASFAIYSREVSRDSILESIALKKILFESRDLLIKNSANESLSTALSDIDLFADSLSYLPFGFVIQTGRFGEDVYNNGFTKQIASKHGKQLLIKTATFSGGKLILSSFMDPTGASFIIVVSYVGISYLIQWDKNNHQRLVIEIQRDRTRYYIQRELTKL